MAVLVLVVTWSLQGLARAQAESDEVPVILLHPGVPTTLRLPEEIEQARILDRGEVRLAIVRDTLYLRPWPGTRAGTRAVLEVKSRTVLRRIPVRVVRHAREAHLALQMSPAGRLDRFQAPPEFPRVGLLRPPLLFQEPPAPATPPVGLSMRGPGPATPTAPAPAESTAAGAPPSRRDASTAYASRIDLSVHALGGLGSTAFHLQGYQSIHARQSHGVFGLRIAAHPHGAWWSVETTISGELPLAPTSHASMGATLAVFGPRVRADLAVKGRLLGHGLTPTVGAGVGLQAHYLDVQVPANDRITTDLPFEGVLALGIGLEYRAGDILFGIELHVRQGMLPGYRSAGAFLSVGRYLDRGEP